MTLLERDAELAALDAFVAEAAAGQGRFAVIEGPAGIGKSGLLADLRARAAGRMRALPARASELEREFAYGVVRQLYEADVVDPARREAALAGAAAPAAPVFGGGTEEGEGAASFAALHGLFWLTLNLSADEPLLLAIDDLHWCDRPSLRFLAYLAHRLEGMPVLVAATLRSAEPGTDPVLLGDILHDSATHALRPGPLSADAVAELVRERLGADAAEPFCAACHEATGGNPLLLRQLLRTLEAEAVRPEGGNAAAVRSVGPRAVSSTVLLRLARLPRDAAAVARAVSVLGESAELQAVAALAGLREVAVADAVRELVRAEIVRPETPLGFVHPLVRDAVYHELSPGERELQHERAASVLRDQGAEPEHLAAQLLMTPRRGEPWVVDVLEAQGAAAMRRGAADSAVAYLRRALVEPPAPERRAAVQLNLGFAELLTLGPAAAEDLRGAYDALEDPVARADVAAVLGRALMFTSRPGPAQALAREARAALPPGEDERAAWLEALELHTIHFQPGTDAAYARLRELHAIADPVDPGHKALAAVAALDVCYGGGPADRACELALAALAGGEVMVIDNGPIALGAVIVLVLADRPEALDGLASARADAHGRGSLFSITGANIWDGFSNLRRGDLAEAEGLFRQAVSQNLDWGFGPIGTAYDSAFLSQLLLERGDVAGARAELDRSADLGDGSDASRWWLAARARVLLAEGRLEAAIAAADDLARRYPRHSNPLACAWRPPKAEALARLGRVDEAVALAEEDLVHARAWGSSSAVGGALTLLGTLRGDAGVLEEAVAVLDGSVAALALARALAAFGSALRRGRRPADAREPLRRALELATSCDATGLAEHVRTELYATGARPRTEALSGPSALTASEKRVVDLAAAGGTNRDIAQALFVTPKTVEVHLSNAYRKLGIRSRRELAGALAA